MSVDLDDRGVMEELDPSGMLGLTEAFGGQCREALALARAISLRPLGEMPRMVVQVGMGGSAAGGDFVKALFDMYGAVPFAVIRDSQMPNYLGAGDLCFCVSYSGDTAETLNAYGAARRAGARVIVVTSGGELRRRAEADGVEILLVPGGRPPRTALGFLLVPVVAICERLGLLPEQPHEEAHRWLDSLVREWGVEAKGNSAKTLARRLHGKLPILYGLGVGAGAVVNRWRCQINENAKQLAFGNLYPELNHNEIMGWVGAAPEDFAGVRLSVHAPLGEIERAGVTQDLIGVPFAGYGMGGNQPYPAMLALAYMGDWVSLYLARLNGVDPADIGRIDELKTRLGKL